MATTLNKSELLTTTLSNTINFNVPNPQRANFDDFYEYGSEIGKGRYATVKLCYCKKTGACFAAKIIKNFRSKNSKLNMNIVENEITALSHVREHPSIVRLYEVFYQRGETILILEYATEKDLHIYLDCEGAFDEEKACHILYQVLRAVEFLHSKDILHLDIKPENVLLMNPLSSSSSNKPNASSSTDSNEDATTVTPLHRRTRKSSSSSSSAATATSSTSSRSPSSRILRDNSFNKKDTTKPQLNRLSSSSSTSCSCSSSSSSSSSGVGSIKVKLCDFSFSQLVQPGKQILGMMGTVAYSAPEVVQYEPLTKATDMWSVGVLAHVLLTEYTPFGNGSEKNMQTETNILSARDKPFKCGEDYFEMISPEAKDFIERLLVFKPKLRLTVQEALAHAWFKKYAVAAQQQPHTCLTQVVEEKPSPQKMLVVDTTNSEIHVATTIESSPSPPSSTSSSLSSPTRKQQESSILNTTTTSIEELIEDTQRFCNVSGGNEHHRHRQHQHHPRRQLPATPTSSSTSHL